MCIIVVTYFPLQEENDVGEFYLSLEKDPQQEDFLQGRMLGNPYGSNEPGLGPLMRDVKNKICQGIQKQDSTVRLHLYLLSHICVKGSASNNNDKG